MHMIKSMTGYGLASASFTGVKYTVEIKSLNSKFLELSLKIPKTFSSKEFALRNECTKRIERGKISISIQAEYAEGATRAAIINQELLNSYYLQLKQISDNLGDRGTNLLGLAVGFPEVMQHEKGEASEDEWRGVYQVFEEALNNFENFRIDEGEVLKKDMIIRINHILSGIKSIEVQEPSRIEVVRDRLNHYLEQSIGKEHIDHNRLEQELIFYIDKLDITEEKIRLRSHCDYFLQALDDQDASGKKLGFISQEIGREINTLGSKANDALIQRLVVGMKEELEKIKEQLLNVL